MVRGSAHGVGGTYVNVKQCGDERGRSFADDEAEPECEEYGRESEDERIGEPALAEVRHRGPDAGEQEVAPLGGVGRRRSSLRHAGSVCVGETGKCNRIDAGAHRSAQIEEDRKERRRTQMDSRALADFSCAHAE